MQNETQEKTVQEMLEEICELGDKIRKQEELKTQNENLQKQMMLQVMVLQQQQFQHKA